MKDTQKTLFIVSIPIIVLSMLGVYGDYLNCYPRFNINDVLCYYFVIWFLFISAFFVVGLETSRGDI